MSDTDRWLRIKQLFRDAQQVAPGERDAWLRRKCGNDAGLLREVRGLLSAQQDSHDLLDAGATGVLQRLRASLADDRSGTRIGAYRLQRLVGEGGMGSVYLAERDTGGFVQRVALKLVRADFVSDAARARFERERNLLARLIHPHIAQLHDGGLADDGTPYFTLEYVEGEPISQWCDTRRLGVHGRVRLVLQVCAAIAYAHRNLIVHRDLKPSNILVTADGEAKLLDFGIAKLVDPDAVEGDTATQARVMTPEYAAPEQVLGDAITTATDVYAIGVLLYELLSGRLPYARADAGTISYPKAVVEESPESFQRALHRTTRRASTTGDDVAAARGTTLPNLRRSLRGDLERIVRRALAKQPEARYASVNDLAEDLHAFIEGRAISGGSRSYRLRMFVRQHWLPLGAAAAIVLIAFASGAAMVWQSRQIARQAQTTLAVKDFLFGLFTAVDPRTAKGREVSARELLDRGAERIGRNRALDVAQHAEVEATLGRIYYQLGLFEEADRLQQAALADLAHEAEASVLFVRTQIDRVDTLVDRTDLKAAQALLDEVRVQLQGVRGVTPVDNARADLAQTRIAVDQRDWAKTAHFADAALVRLRAAPDADPALLRRAMTSAGVADWGLGKAADAEQVFRKVIAAAQADGEAESIEIAKANTNLGFALQIQSRYREASDAAEKALALYSKLLGADHLLTVSAQRDLALTHYRLGLYPQARREFEDNLATERRKFGDGHPLIAGTEINLGNLLVDSGEAAAADKVLTEALAIFEKKYGRDYDGARQSLGNLAVAHAGEGRLDQAESELRDLLERERKDTRQTVVDDIDSYRLGDVMRLKGRFTEAIALQRDALESLQKLHGENHRWTAAAHRYLALSLRDSGDAAAAERELRAALAGFPTAEPPFIATVKYDLGGLLLRRADSRSEGVELLVAAVELREKFLGSDSPLTREAREALRAAQVPAKT